VDEQRKRKNEPNRKKDDGMRRIDDTNKDMKLLDIVNGCLKFNFFCGFYLLKLREVYA